MIHSSELQISLREVCNHRSYQAHPLGGLRFDSDAVESLRVIRGRGGVGEEGGRASGGDEGSAGDVGPASGCEVQAILEAVVFPGDAIPGDSHVAGGGSFCDGGNLE